MKKIVKDAADKLYDMIGQNKVMVLATKTETGVAARSVNIYQYNGDFYFITEQDSNKYKQLQKQPCAALAVDAIQIAGKAVLEEHPSHPDHADFISSIEKVLPGQFDQYADVPIMRLVRVTPEFSSFMSLKNGEGYVIDFSADHAWKITHPM